MKLIILAVVLIIASWLISKLFVENLFVIAFPLILIFIGYKYLKNQRELENKLQNNEFSEVSNYDINTSVNINGTRLLNNTKDFKGFKIIAFFGGQEIDLKETQILEKHEATIKIISIFGGTKIITPKNWKVKIELSGIGGRLENKTYDPSTEEAKGTLIIQVKSFFGGGEVLN